jgi:hypothetical protein
VQSDGAIFAQMNTIFAQIPFYFYGRGVMYDITGRKQRNKQRMRGDSVVRISKGRRIKI